ncbi:MAG: orotidine-5'-phosphate decarboxylase [Chloroflexi bacterium]|jgi:uridine monophosphate synthetase|nr:orotidine-5'-phosphate decarboxylase [Chloroflexota bacterium]
MTFFEFLENRVNEVDSLLCVGLDPHRSDLPEWSGRAAVEFCLRLIEATADLAVAYKPNAAFFESLGSEGVIALQEVIAAIPEGIPVLLDAKRGDIASTAQAYADAAFETLGADAITLSPYLGRDSVEPFIADPEKGVFLLCKTSNPGASDLQDLIVTGDRRLDADETPFLRPLPPVRLYEHVARLAQSWNTNDNIGLVVGATQPESLARVRAAAPDLWILAPGVGAQGGDLRAALSAGLRTDGLGMLIPVSRGISRADDPRQAALEFRDAINAERAKAQPSTFNLQPNNSLADGLLEAGCIQFGRFTLKSGTESPIYIDLRRLVGYPKLLSQVALAYLDILQNVRFDHLAALPYAAMPIAAAISLHGDIPMIYPRKETKAYGTKAQIEGVYEPGQRAVVIDDLISTGGSKFEGIEKLEFAGLEVEDVVVLIDRRPNGQNELAERGYNLHAVLTIANLLNYYAESGKVTAEKIRAAREFFSDES